MHLKRSQLLPALIVCLAFLALPVSGAFGKTPKSVAILPFTMNADRDLSFLRDGIMDMLASRLAWKGEVEIIERGRVSEKTAPFKGLLNKEKGLLIGKALGADYVIVGSLTVFGESVSIDARILDVAKSQELITAFNQSKGMDEVIPTVNRFALDINEKIMGRVVQAAISPGRPGTVRGPGGLMGAEQVTGGPGKPAHIQRLSLEARSLDVGDVDGDGKSELVIVDRDTVYLYKWRQKGFSRLAALKGSWSPDYVYVSLGDMDKNGRSEIYVSGKSGGNLSSLVLEWDGKGLKTIASGQPWFFRVIRMPAMGLRLLGQKRATNGGYRGGVQLLKREGNKFVSEGPLKLPRQGNVFNFIFAPFESAKRPYIVMLSPYERLLVYAPNGEQVWRSQDLFGGSLTFMDDKENQGRPREMADQGQRLFFASPIYLTDVDEDHHPEVVICKNRSSSGRITEYMRDFVSGKVHFLVWDGTSLSTKWTSGKLSDAVVGYRVADVDNDGLPELLVAAVSGGGLSMRKARTQLVFYDLK